MNDDIGTLPAKTRPGLDLDKVFTPGKNVSAMPVGTAPRVSRPDLALPSATALSNEEWRPVRMMRHYRPVGDYQIGVEDEDGAVLEWRDRPELEGDANPGLEHQVKEGMLVNLRKSEAQIVYKAGIADRADEFN